MIQKREMMKKLFKTNLKTARKALPGFYKQRDQTGPKYLNSTYKHPLNKPAIQLSQAPT